MTNSKGGLKSRLQQFDNTINGGDGHGGAQRVAFKHPDYRELTSHLYVSVCPFACDVTLNDPKNLRIMGEVVNQPPEVKAGPLALPHFQQESQQALGHTFYETGKRKARKKKP